MLAHPQRFVCLNATRRALFGCTPGVYGDEVRAFPFALVFEHSQERPPRGAGSVSRVAGKFNQSLRVQVLNRYKVVFTGVVRREFVQEVSGLALQVGVASSDCFALLLPVVRAVFFPREVTLGAFQSFAFVEKAR